MISDTIFSWISTASPTVIYLGGVVFLFLRLEKAQQSNVAALTALVERYHSLVSESVHTLAIINERLDK